MLLVDLLLELFLFLLQDVYDLLYVVSVLLMGLLGYLVQLLYLLLKYITLLLY